MSYKKYDFFKDDFYIKDIAMFGILPSIVTKIIF